MSSTQTPFPSRSKRGLAVSLVLTFLFHVASFLYGIFLLLVLGLTCGMALLVVMCVCSGSSRSVRVLVAFLWRMEIRVNALGKEKDEDVAVQNQSQNQPSNTRSDDRIEVRNQQRGASGGSLSAQNQQRQEYGREVTTSVMVLSLLYFLLFKWLFNIIFSAIPLGLWFVALAQVLPSDSVIENAGIANATSITAKLFTALAFAFFAHQIGVSAAHGSVYVSDMMTGFLFDRDDRSERTSSFRPLLFDDYRYEPMPIHQHHASMHSGSQYEYGTMGIQDQSGGARPPADEESGARRPLQATQSLYNDRWMAGSIGSQSDEVPRLEKKKAASMQSMPTSSHFGARETQNAPPHGLMPFIRPIPPIPPFARPGPNDFDRSFGDTEEEREFNLCGLRVVVKHGDRGGRGGRGGIGSGIRGGRGDIGSGRRGGRGAMRFPGMFDHFHDRNRDPFGFSNMDARQPHFPNDAHRASISRDSQERIPYASPALMRDPSTSSIASSQDPRAGFEKFKKGRKNFRHRRVKRRNSFDSVYVTHVPAISGDIDMKHAGHTSLYDVLDLVPSAPLLPPRHAQSYIPTALDRDDDIPPSQSQLQKSRSDGDRYIEHMYKQDSSYVEQLDRSDLADFKTVQLQAGKEYVKPSREQVQAQRLQEQARQARDQEKKKQEQAQRARDQARKQEEQSQRAREQAHQQEEKAHELRLRSKEERVAKDPQVSMDFRLPEGVHDVDQSLALLERDVDAKERELFAKEIEQAAQEALEMNQPDTENGHRSSDYEVPMASSTFTISRLPTPPPPKTRLRGRQGFISDREVRSNGAVPRRDSISRVGDKSRAIDIATPFQTGVSHDISDYEIHRAFGSLPRESYDDDVHNLRSYAPIDFSNSPASMLTSLPSSPLYRSGNQPPAYNLFSPLGSPSSTGRGSFLESHEYDALSPTNSLHNGDFSSEDFQQVYRSIRYTGPASAPSEFESVPGRRDKVNFNAFAPASVCPSPKPFNFTVWAFLLNQREEMRERAETENPDSRQLSVDTKIDVRRGALVHVMLEVPTGFRILNEPTQGFPWEGKITNVTYNIECTEGAGFGQVLFKARIVVGSDVAMLRSYITVSSKRLDPADFEAQMLESKLEVLEKTFEEIPYTSLEMKELVGKGYFGDAYRATYKGQDVVIKTIRASEFGETNDQILKEFQHEAAVLSMFGHHPCIVPFVGASTDMRYPLGLITKYLPFGSLEDNLQRPNAQVKFSVRQKTLMLKDAAAGLLNIHEGGFIHRDIAARNCLVDGDLRVRIADFGLCRRINAKTGSLMKDAVGPVKYMAPESLQPPHAFSFDTDSYMFGVLMWETYTSTPPFSSMTPVEAMMHVVRGERLSIPTNLPSSIQSLIESCFHDTPSERPSMGEILSALDNSVSMDPKVSLSVASAATASLSSTNLNRRDRSIWV